MTMHRRPLGHGRTLAAIAGVLMVVGCALPWWRLEQVGGPPALTGNGLELAAFVVFLVGIATLALVSLPYALGDRPTAIDIWLSFGVLAVIGWLGFVVDIVQLVGLKVFHFTELAQIVTNGPGLWLAGIGLIVLSRAAYDVAREPTRR